MSEELTNINTQNVMLIWHDPFNPYIPSWGHIWSFSEHIHASDKYISSFILVRSFTGHNRVKYIYCFLVIYNIVIECMFYEI